MPWAGVFLPGAWGIAGRKLRGRKRNARRGKLLVIGAGLIGI